MFACRELGLTGLKTLNDFSGNPPIMHMLYRIFVALALAAVYVAAEKHTVSFVNGSVVAFVNSRRHH